MAARALCRAARIKFIFAEDGGEVSGTKQGRLLQAATKVTAAFAVCLSLVDANAATVHGSARRAVGSMLSAAVVGVGTVHKPVARGCAKGMMAAQLH